MPLIVVIGNFRILTFYHSSFMHRNSYKPIIKYIDEQFERFLNDESGLNRRNISDNRVHCCFYFISPLGHG
jgi:septin family protein